MKRLGVKTGGRGVVVGGFLALAALLCLSVPAEASLGYPTQTVSIAANGTTAGACEDGVTSAAVSTTTSGTVGIDISGTWTGTLVFYVKMGSGGGYVSYANATPLPSGSAASSTTANGDWTIPAKGSVAVCVAFSASAQTGTAVVQLNSSPASATAAPLPSLVPQLFAMKQWQSCRIGHVDLSSQSGFTCSMDGWTILTSVYGSGSNESSSVFASTFFVEANADRGTAVIGPSGIDNTSFSFDPVYTQYAGFQTSAANARMWVAIGSTSDSACTYLGAVGVVTSSTATSCKFAAIGADIAVAANYQCCTGNGTSYNCADTGVPVDAAYHTFSVRIPANQSAPLVTCGIDGVSHAAPTATATPSNAFLAAFPFTAMTAKGVGAVYLNYGWNTLETY